MSNHKIIIIMILIMGISFSQQILFATPFQNSNTIGQLYTAYYDNKIAHFMILGKDTNGTYDILFKGPSNIKIKASLSCEKYPGNIVEFIFYLPKGVIAELKRYIADVYIDQKKPAPIAYLFDKHVKVCGSTQNDGKQEFERIVSSEFSKYPQACQIALREFYLFVTKNIERTGITICNTEILFGDELNYEKQELNLTINNNQNEIDAFFSDFKFTSYIYNSNPKKPTKNILIFISLLKFVIQFCTSQHFSPF